MSFDVVVGCAVDFVVGVVGHVVGAVVDFVGVVDAVVACNDAVADFREDNPLEDNRDYNSFGSVENPSVDCLDTPFHLEAYILGIDDVPDAVVDFVADFGGCYDFEAYFDRLDYCC